VYFRAVACQNSPDGYRPDRGECRTGCLTSDVYMGHDDTAGE
jgi:hypothetical protein